MVCNAEPEVVNNDVLWWASGCEPWCDMVSQWLWIILCYACESCQIILSHWLWIMVCCAVPVVVSHGELYSAWCVHDGVICYANGCDSCSAILIRVVVNRSVLCWASGCVSWCVMLRQWLWIMVCHSETVIVNHGVLLWASGCESWCAILSHPVVVNHR